MSAVLAPTLVSLRIVSDGAGRRLLDSLETHALVRAHGEGPATRDDEAEAGRVIRRLVAKDERLICECRADGVGVMMRPHLLPDGRGALRAPGHAHEPGCPFRVSTAPRGQLPRPAAASRPSARAVAAPRGFRVPLTPLIRAPMPSDPDAVF